MIRPATVDELQEAVRASPRVRVRGGGSKPALSQGATLELSRLAGVLEYEPQEYTFTALAGTPVAEVEAALAAQGQYLPFDPPFARAGATLGGTVAAGLSGPGRQRYGGVRDFLLGATLVSAAGERLETGGKVVKNAAGFDVPKLMVGSLGRFGVLAELTFKVFPRPEAFATLRLTLPSLAEAVAAMNALAASPLEPFSLELCPPGTLSVRVGGRPAALARRLGRLQAFVGRAGETLTGAAEAALWEEARAFGWAPGGHGLVKVALSPAQVMGLEHALAARALPRRYGVGGNVCYLAWPEAEDAAELGALLGGLGLSGLALTGRWPRPRLGRVVGGAFLRRLEGAFDPEGKFGAEVPDAA